jgi:cytochrome c553
MEGDCYTLALLNLKHIYTKRYSRFKKVRDCSMKKIITGFILSITLFSLLSVAAGDAKRGQLASAACAACHGSDGNSPSPEWPNLAGQSEKYIARQLQEFRKGPDGNRFNPIMYGLVAELSDQQIADLAAYYATLTPKAGEADPDMVALGRAIYLGGNAANGVPACAACHGPAGMGNNQAAFPLLAGQHAQYTQKQLLAYRNGELTSEQAKIMQMIAQRMQEDEIKAVASFIQGLN